MPELKGIILPNPEYKLGNANPGWDSIYARLHEGQVLTIQDMRHVFNDLKNQGKPSIDMSALLFELYSGKFSKRYDAWLRWESYELSSTRDGKERETVGMLFYLNPPDGIISEALRANIERAQQSPTVGKGSGRGVEPRDLARFNPGPIGPYPQE